ncbi:MAG: MFS transporter [bacterium]
MKRTALHLKPLDYATALSFAVYAASVTVTPISLVALSRELGISLVGGGTIEAVRASLLIPALLISGWAAAHFGKAVALGASTALLGAGLLAYAFAPGYAAILLAVGMVGFGGGVIEALLNPLIQDLHPGDSGRYLNFLNAFFSVGVFITVISGGEWITQGGSWRYIMGALGLLCLIAAALFISLQREAPREAERGVRVVLSRKLSVLKNPRFWLFFVMMFLGGGAEGGLTFWSASYIQLQFGSVARIGGIGTASFAAGMIVGRVASGHFVRQHHLHRLIAGSAAGGFLVGMLLPHFSGIPLLIAGLFAAGLSIACFWPSIQSYAADRIEADNTALFILLSCGGIPGFGFAAWLMGIIGETSGLNASLYVIPVFLGLLGVLVLIERNWKRVE